jgi:hypothetical protein
MALPINLRQYIFKKRTSKAYKDILNDTARLTGQGDQMCKERKYIVEIELFYYFLLAKTDKETDKLIKSIFENWDIPMDIKKYTTIMRELHKQFWNIDFDPLWRMTVESMAESYSFIFGICLMKCVDLFIACLLGIENGIKLNKYHNMMCATFAGVSCEFRIGYADWEDEPDLYYDLITYNFFDISKLIFDHESHREYLEKFVKDNNISAKESNTLSLIQKYLHDTDF